MPNPLSQAREHPRFERLKVRLPLEQELLLRIVGPLIVNDLKLGDSSGAVARWIGPGTEGYFTGLAIKPTASR